MKLTREQEARIIVIQDKLKVFDFYEGDKITQKRINEAIAELVKLGEEKKLVLMALRKSNIKPDKEESDKAKPIIFNYEAVEPERQVIELSQLKDIIKKNFPTIWFETKACLSACATLSLKNLNGCPSLNLVGNPSGEKTTALSFFYGQDQTYISDDFSPKAFVSHSANMEADKLEAIDLLPKIKNKILITPELAPLFKAPKDNLIENFAMLTRVLDGEGLNRDSGTHGHRGYSGDYKFIWLGGTTPLEARVWNVMGTIGNRLFFLGMREKNRTQEDYVNMFRGKAYEERVKVCRGAVRSFLNHLFIRNGIRKFEWDTEQDILLLPEIVKYARFLSKLRASLITWKGEDRGNYEYSFPIIEEPPRAINSLYNLAKGHALIHGRNFLRSEDIELVRAVCFSSMPHDRSEFLKLLAKHEGKLTTKQIERELNCSQDTALRTMKTFEVMGVVTIKSIQVEDKEAGRPMSYIEINPEFAELLRYTQGLNNEVNIKHDKIEGVRDEYENYLHGLSHPLNNKVNTLSQEINPASEVCNICGSSDNLLFDGRDFNFYCKEHINAPAGDPYG